MGLFRKVNVNGQNLSSTKITELSLSAVDAIMLTGFQSTEELYSLLNVNCMSSDLIIDECLKELANIYNKAATKNSELLHQPSCNPNLKESYITNVVLIGDKIKMISDVRSYIALQSKPKDTKYVELPLNGIKEEDLLDAKSVISSIAAAVPDNIKRPQLSAVKKEANN